MLKFFGFYDFIAATIVVLNNRESMPPLYKLEYSIYFQNPGVHVPSTYFVSVFQLKFWTAICFIIFINFGCIFIFVKVKKLSFHTLIKIKMHIYGISLEKLENIKSSWTFQICSISIAIFMICIASSFSAFLIAHMSVNKFNMSFKTLDDVLRQNEYSICIRSKSIAYQLLVGNQNYFSPTLNPEICHDPVYVMTIDEKIEHLKKTICAHKHLLYIGQVNIFQTLYQERYLLCVVKKMILIENNFRKLPCDIIKIKPNFFPSYASYPINRKFRYSEATRVFITNLRSIGITTKIHTDVRYSPSHRIATIENPYHKDTEIVAIIFGHICLIFGIYATMMVLSVIILGIEILVHARKIKLQSISSQHILHINSRLRKLYKQLTFAVLWIILTLTNKIRI